MSSKNIAESPCINICSLDPASGLCLGCLRNMEEIANWASFSNEHKHKILDKHDERKLIITNV